MPDTGLQDLLEAQAAVAMLERQERAKQTRRLYRMGFRRFRAHNPQRGQIVTLIEIVEQDAIVQSPRGVYRTVPLAELFPVT